MNELGFDTSNVLRIGVKGGGCSGLSYLLAFDKKTEKDNEYEVEGIPGWASTPESRRTFPKISKDMSIQSATATLVKDSNGGWVVQPTAPHGEEPPVRP